MERPIAPRPCVLVHGSWHGGWHWDEVAARLRAGGILTLAPTLTGLAERVTEATADTGLSVHVADVVALLDGHDLRDVVLVGHSYGGLVITGAAHARPERVSTLLYLDAFVPRDGESAASILGDEFVDTAKAAATQAGTPHLIPPLFDVEQFLGWTGARAEAFAARMCSHPLATMFEPVHAPGEPDVERAFVYCSTASLGLFDAYAEHARRDPDWRYFELPCRHDAVHLMPAAVSGIVESLAVAA